MYANQQSDFYHRNDGYQLLVVGWRFSELSNNNNILYVDL